MHPPSPHGLPRVIGPVALWRGLRCCLLHHLAEPKHHARPFPLRCWFLGELLFWADLELLGICSFGFGCGWAKEHSSQSSQLPTNSIGRARIPAYRHLPDPIIESVIHLDVRSLATNTSRVVANR